MRAGLISGGFSVPIYVVWTLMDGGSWYSPTLIILCVLALAGSGVVGILDEQRLNREEEARQHADR